MKKQKQISKKILDAFTIKSTEFNNHDLRTREFCETLHTSIFKIIKKYFPPGKNTTLQKAGEYLLSLNSFLIEIATEAETAYELTLKMLGNKLWMNDYEKYRQRLSDPDKFNMLHRNITRYPGASSYMYDCEKAMIKAIQKYFPYLAYTDRVPVFALYYWRQFMELGIMAAKVAGMKKKPILR